MKSRTEEPMKHSCCPEGKIESSRLSKVLGIDHQASNIKPPHSSLLTLATSERRAIEAHKLQVEQRRVTAIENARRVTYV